MPSPALRDISDPLPCKRRAPQVKAPKPLKKPKPSASPPSTLVVEEHAAPELQAATIVEGMQRWSMAGVKSFVRHLKGINTAEGSKTADGRSFTQREMFRGHLLPLSGSKTSTLEDLEVIVKSAVILEQNVSHMRIIESEDTPQFCSARLRNYVQEYHPVSRSPVVAAFNAVEVEEQASREKKSAAKSRNPGAKRLEQQFQSLEKVQLSQLLVDILDRHPELVSEVEERLPAADVEPVLANCQKLVNAIHRAMPNTRWGSSRDAFCQRRCGGHVTTAKAAIMKGLQIYKSCKQWDVALKFAERALPMAKEIPVWDDASKNGPREAVIKALDALIAEAQKKIEA
ncbi:hypothetical protein CYMTET_19626 [Cymbomonas tetramitiformis]|uniref:Uncharacterized protein n=1 Tax=Cymbomonas tetramitiformis TaxID=36881 RepID=A0AAE0G5N2_9CHLO|nr:hypothetical protein CYMTET_19626 [Cymbomonas tetramitiformis]